MESGTSIRPKKPFVRPALNKTKKQIAEKMKSIIEDATKEIFFDVNGVFKYQSIPSGHDEASLIDDDVWNIVTLTESIVTDFDIEESATPEINDIVEEESPFKMNGIEPEQTDSQVASSQKKAGFRAPSFFKPTKKSPQNQPK